MIVTIFRSRLKQAHIDEYRALAPKMLELARSMPGFISFKTFAGDDNERVSIIEFDTLDNLNAWRDHPRHVEAQRLGRERFYASYSVQVCQPVRSYHFPEDVERN